MDQKNVNEAINFFYSTIEDGLNYENTLDRTIDYYELNKEEIELLTVAVSHLK